MRKSWLVVSLLVLVVLVASMVGCTKQPTPAQAPAPVPTTAAPTTAKPTTAAPTTAAPTTATTTYTFKFSSDSPPGYYNAAWVSLTKAIEAESKGRIKFDMYPNQSLLPTKTFAQGIAQGIADCGNSAVVAYGPGAFPMAGLAFLPFTWLPGFNIEAARSKFNAYGPVASEFEKAGLKLIESPLTPENAFASNKPIRTFEDMQGLKARSFAVIFPKMLEACGSLAVSLPIQDAYTGLQTGLINASPGTFDHIYDFKLHEVAKNVIVFPGGSITYSMVEFVWNLNAWNKLPKDIQDIVTRVVNSKAWGSDAWYETHLAGQTQLAKAGIPIYNMPPSEKAKFVAKADEVAKWWIDYTKPQGPSQDVYNYFMSVLKEYGLR